MALARMRDGSRLHYLDVGRGPPCVLLHGFGMRASLWLPFVAALAPRYRFILPDLRGFGGSHGLPLARECLLSQHADDVADLLDALDLRDVRLGGLSMGACAALQFHRLHGFARVRAYLHVDQGVCVRNRDDWQHGLLGPLQYERLAAWRALVAELSAYERHLPFRRLPRALRRRLWAALSEFFAYAFHSRSWRAVCSLAQYESLIRWVAPTHNWPIYVDSLRSYLERDYDWRDSLPAMDVPMTALVGMRSRMYPAAGQLAIGELVPHARIVRFENCGHGIPFEAPLRFTWELGRFLRD